MPGWHVNKGDAAAGTLFPDLATASVVAGDEINANWMSRLVLASNGERAFYVKVYLSRGRWLRRFMGRSRVRAEWENLALFETLSVPTAKLIAYGEGSVNGHYCGIVVTEAIPASCDLASMAQAGDVRLRDKEWVAAVSLQLAEMVAKLHANGFIHSDLKWRNVLVTDGKAPSVFLIDCPQGRRLPGPLKTRGIVKDLACLDKVAKQVLSNAQRLRFYLTYRGMTGLNENAKQEVRQVLAFFKGRE